MAKTNKKKRKSKLAGTSWDALAAATLATVGNTLGQLIADGAEHMVARRVAGGSDSNGAVAPPPVPQQDVAGEILRMLRDDGEKTIVDLVGATGEGLTRTLDALRSLRDFRLVNLADDGGLVQLTDSGRRTAAALHGDESELAPEEKEEAEAYPE